MASTLLNCFGDLDGFTPAFKGIRTAQNSAQPFYPSTALEDDTRAMQMIEIFFALPAVVQNSQPYLVSFRDPSSSTSLFELRFFLSGIVTPICIFRDRNNSGIAIQLSQQRFTLGQMANNWMHFVVYNTGTSAWVAQMGRTGKKTDGSFVPGDAQTFTAIPGNGTQYNYGVAAQGTGDAFFRGLRNTSSGNTTGVLGGQILSSTTGALGGSASRWPGVFAEFRCWRNRPVGTLNNLPSPGTIDVVALRDEFIDSSSQPDLIHCFRLNENGGSNPLNYDDVGFKDARFVTEAVGGGFNSHPFPEVAGMEVLLNDGAVTRGNAFLIATGDLSKDVSLAAAASDTEATADVDLSMDRDMPVTADVVSEADVTLSVENTYAVAADVVSDADVALNRDVYFTISGAGGESGATIGLSPDVSLAIDGTGGESGATVALNVDPALFIDGALGQSEATVEFEVVGTPEFGPRGSGAGGAAIDLVIERSLVAGGDALSTATIDSFDGQKIFEIRADGVSGESG